MVSYGERSGRYDGGAAGMGVVTIRRHKSVLAPAGLSGSGWWIEEEWFLGNGACVACSF